MDFFEVGHLREWAPGEDLRADVRRSQAAPQGRSPVAARDEYRPALLQYLGEALVTRLRVFVLPRQGHRRRASKRIVISTTKWRATWRRRRTSTRGRGSRPKRRGSPRSAASAASTQVSQVHREARSFMWLDDLRQDIRYTRRTLVRNPVFALVVVLTLALGIGANTAIFTLLDAVVFRPLPVPAAAELLMLYENGPEGTADATGGTGRFLRFSYPTVRAAAAGARRRRIACRGDPQCQVCRTAAGCDRASLPPCPARVRRLLLDPAGASRTRRGFSTAATWMAAAPVAVVSDGFWRRRLGAWRHRRRPDDRRQRRDCHRRRRRHRRDFSASLADADADIWLPLTLQPALHYAEQFQWLRDDRLRRAVGRHRTRSRG